MYELVIGDNEYKLPKDIMLMDYVQLYKRQDDADFILGLAMKIPKDDIAVIPEKTKALAVGLVDAILNPTWVPMNNEVRGCKLINFNTITLGQFIDLEVYTQDYYKYVPEIVKILYNTNETEDWGIGEVHSAIQGYYNWRKALYFNYKNLFGAVYENDELVEDTQDKPVKNNNTAHAWYDIALLLADGKFLNLESVYEKSVIEAFNWLAWNKENKLKEAEAIRKQKQKR